MYRKALSLTCLSLVAESWAIVWSIDYRVDGDVTGLGFRNFTQIKARELGLRGYIRHNDYHSEGVIEGPWETIDAWKKYVRLGCCTDPPIPIFAINYVKENTIHEYNFDDFYVLPSINMDDVEDSVEDYKDLFPDSSKSALIKEEQVIKKKKEFKTFTRIKGLIAHRITVRVASRKYEEEVNQEFLKLNGTYENIRKLYNQ